MYQAECSAVKGGASFPILMEKAGQACADIIFDSFCAEQKNILVLCGKGKNGGDGFVIARSLKEKGCAVTVLLACGEPAAEDAVTNFRLLEDIAVISDYNEAFELLKKPAVIVEAVFGTGFRGSLDEKLSSLAEAVNNSTNKVICIDVPGGIDCDSAKPEGTVFKADMTVAISALKPVHVIKPYNSLCGEIRVADIGITEADILSVQGKKGFVLDDKVVAGLLPERPEVSNKGTFGHALCVCGSKNMPGAACIAVSSALRSGAGLVTAAFPESAYPAIASKITEALMLTCPETEEGTFSRAAFDIISEKMKKATAVLAGCGLGLNPDTVRLVKKLVRASEKPLVIDADGLNALSTEPEILKLAKAPVVVTPHPGEMSRLCGRSIEEILSDPVEAASTFADEFNCTVVLKTANTVVCAPGKETYYLNTSGSPALAKGGSGDMLAGIITSLLAQGMNAFDAAVCGTYLHSGCADELTKYSSGRGTLPTDIINFMPVYLRRFN